MNYLLLFVFVAVLGIVLAIFDITVSDWRFHVISIPCLIAVHYFLFLR